MKALTLVLVALFSSPAPAQPREGEAEFFQQEEAFLESFDINDPDNGLSLLGGLEGTSMILKIKDPSGRTVGAFKPTGGNTLYEAEVAAYRLCRRLELPVCAPTVVKSLDSASLDRFSILLEEVEFAAEEGDKHAGHYRSKERFRQAMMEKIADAESLPGAFKSWINPLILYQGLGDLAAVEKHELREYLNHDGPPDGGRPIELRQCTKIYKPKGCWRAELRIRDLLDQFVGMLAVDALIADNDRFAGGNVHLFSIDARYTREEDGWYRLPAPSLLMLDNGAGFMGARTPALDVIRKKLKITRFPRRLYEGLEALERDLKADRRGLLAELGIPQRTRHAGRTLAPAKVFIKNLKELLRYMRSVESRHGEAAFYR
jgi:hypothetical protein